MALNAGAATVVPLDTKALCSDSDALPNYFVK
jgi:hypothetical protein